jgi:peroxiredoxin
MTIYCTENERSMYEERGYWRALPELVPSVVFNTRVYSAITREYTWENVNTFDLFADRRVLMFSLPGAFTPTCSTYQLPTFEQLAEEFYAEGITDIICMTVNDAFVCNAWAKANDLMSIRVIPDGSGKFTEAMNMMVDKDNLGFGRRSWRYACVVDNGTITDWFIEEGREDNHPKDPYMFTKPEYILEQLRGGN